MNYPEDDQHGDVHIFMIMFKGIENQTEQVLLPNQHDDDDHHHDDSSSLLESFTPSNRLSAS